MIDAILLDTGPLGEATQPNPTPGALACRAWLAEMVVAGVTIYIPEVCDYELRRELIRAGKKRGIAHLDAMAQLYNFLPVNQNSWRLAASLWAEARRAGRPTADPKELDGDVILAAQALSLGVPRNRFVIATTNVGHLSRFAPAKLWTDITSDDVQ